MPPKRNTFKRSRSRQQSFSKSRQTMKSKAEVQRIASAEVPSAEYLQASVHVTPNVIKLRSNGEYISIWRLEGITFETANAEDLHLKKEHFNTYLRSLGGGQYALWSHKVRRLKNDRLSRQFSNDFCTEVDEKYNATFEQYRMLQTDLFLTLVYRPTPADVGGTVTRFFNRLSVRSIEQRSKQELECLDVMEDISNGVETSLSEYGPQRLGTFERNGIEYSEMATLLAYLVNGVWEDVPLRHAALSEYLPSSRLLFGDRNGLLQIRHPASPEKFVSFLDFQTYPKFSQTGMNNHLLYGNYEYIETQSFAILNNFDAVEEIERQEKQLISGEEASVTEIEEMKQAVDGVRNSHIVMGEYHYSLAVFGESIEQAMKNAADARGQFQGFKMSAIDIVPESAWFAQQPGNWRLRPRKAQITSLNFAALSPFHNFAMGKRNGNPWGEAVALLKTLNGQPFFFNFHASPPKRDNTDEKKPGSTVIFGQTGSGKTTLIGFLLTQANKFSPRIVAFDMNRTMEMTIRMMGGKYRSLRRGQYTGINPFQWDDTPQTRALCRRVVEKCVSESSAAVTPRESQEIESAVKTVFEQLPKELRRLAAVDQNLSNVGDNSLGLRLRKWVGTGSVAWVMDSPTDTLAWDSNRIFGFDYTEFLDDPEIRSVLMMVLLEAVEGLVDGTPFIYIMEEFWKPLLDPVFLEFSRENQKTIRAKNGIGIFVTQSPSDALSSPIAKTMVEQSATLILLPNPQGDYKDYVEGYKVTPQEFNIVKNLALDSRMFLVKQGARSALVRLDLGGMPEVITIISGAEDNLQLLDEIIAEVGDDPKAWRPILWERVQGRKILKHEISVQQ
jgi:type IV secretion system protein VirB4